MKCVCFARVPKLTRLVELNDAHRSLENKESKTARALLLIEREFGGRGMESENEKRASGKLL
jgi:hypothetical protein